VELKKKVRLLGVKLSELHRVGEEPARTGQPDLLEGVLKP